jgi:hypothetical protein
LLPAPDGPCQAPGISGWKALIVGDVLRNRVGFHLLIRKIRSYAACVDVWELVQILRVYSGETRTSRGSLALKRKAWSYPTLKRPSDALLIPGTRHVAYAAASVHQQHVLRQSALVSSGALTPGTRHPGNRVICRVLPTKRMRSGRLRSSQIRCGIHDDS